jgi:hypothetical protein
MLVSEWYHKMNYNPEDMDKADKQFYSVSIAIIIIIFLIA